MSLSEPFTVYAPGLAGVPKDERYMSPGVVRRIVARGDANLTLRNVLRMLKSNEEHWDGFLFRHQSIFPNIQINIDFDENTEREYYFFPLRVASLRTRAVAKQMLLSFWVNSSLTRHHMFAS